MREPNLKCIGFQQLTVSSAAVGVTVPSSGDRKARMAIIQCESQDVRWRDDGTNPTAAVGMLLKANSDLVYTGDLTALKLIRATGADGLLNVAFYE